jgi:hypothetical protein
LDGYEHFYGSQNLNFTEISSGTPDILISAGPETSSSTWAATRPVGVQRDPSDVTDGWSLSSAPINFNSTSTYPMGFQTLGINWDYQNPSGKNTRGFEIRTRGTSNTTPIFHYDGSASRHFNTYDVSSIGAPNQKNDLLHVWSDPDPGDFSPSDVIHVGVEQDVWDWTVISAQVVHPDNTRTNAPVLWSHDWSQTITGVFSSPGVPDESDAQGIHMGPPLKILAQGIQLGAPESSPVEIVSVGMAIVDDMKLGLDDLNRRTLDQLVKDQQFEILDIPQMTLDNGQLMTLVLDGDPFEPENPVFIPGGERWVDHELFLYVQTTDPNGAMTIGNYALLGTPPIAGVFVPEPASFALLLIAGMILIGRIRPAR